MTETIKFYTDAHIAKRIITQLREQGADIVRCEEVDLKYAADDVHLEYATHQDRVIVTFDEDFLRLHSQWLAAGREHTGIIFILSRLQGQTGAIVNELLFLFEAVQGGAATLKDDVRNRVLYIG